MGNEFSQESSSDPAYDFLWPAAQATPIVNKPWQPKPAPKVSAIREVSSDNPLKLAPGTYPLSYGPPTHNQPLTKACKSYNPELIGSRYVYDPCHPPESYETGANQMVLEEEDDRPIKVFENVLYVPVPIPRQIYEEVHVPVDYVEKIIEEPVYVPEVVELPRGPVKKIPRIKYVEVHEKPEFRRAVVDRIVPYPEICDQKVQVEVPVVQEIIRRVPKVQKVPHYVESMEPRFEYVDQIFEIPELPGGSEEGVLRLERVVDMKYMHGKSVLPREPHWGKFQMPRKGISSVHGPTSAYS
mmetsp:Transcript_52554/g.115262  ORF Transcript_52554/g.115262 Transcript_52554/m.115262 type:complete len:298 (+) Transcript_52554:95-988(+)|eukprot:CAMPEP_0204261098 /NCGR_PEP_ID=MMETSP0468-20130131/6774_1 /ASSEMBLY_ACC=CAM_ASM_000383 /TAXON_ID=2969 /ORGANISM="Oxyrrhis marina" /LENGTH=297 /DNA_ID=CAMNT_0051235603 /DNA_START=14 /DNA_END=907 /DNA_ORIENTATION=+